MSNNVLKGRFCFCSEVNIEMSLISYNKLIWVNHLLNQTQLYSEFNLL